MRPKNDALVRPEDKPILLGFSSVTVEWLKYLSVVTLDIKIIHDRNSSDILSAVDTRDIVVLATETE